MTPHILTRSLDRAAIAFVLIVAGIDLSAPSIIAMARSGFHWGILTLLPSDEKIAAFVQRIVVAGSRNQIRSIEYLQADGDRSLLLIEALDSR